MHILSQNLWGKKRSFKIWSHGISARYYGGGEKVKGYLSASSMRTGRIAKIEKKKEGLADLPDPHMGFPEMLQ